MSQPATGPTPEQLLREAGSRIDPVDARILLLHALERAAFYTVSPERRSSGSLPVKESFFLLPSGRFAVGRTIDFGADSLMLRVYGSSEKLDAFLALLRPLGLTELVRSGKILMARGLQET